MCVYIYMYVYKYMCVCVYVCMCIHVYICVFVPETTLKLNILCPLCSVSLLVHFYIFFNPRRLLYCEEGFVNVTKNRTRKVIKNSKRFQPQTHIHPDRE